MHTSSLPLFLCLPYFFVLTAMGDQLSIGAVIDVASRIGKEEKMAMEMAINDSYKYTNHRPDLYITDSAQAIQVINDKRVSAAVGFRIWDEATFFLGEYGNRAKVPILSFAETIPIRASKRWPYLIAAKHNQYKQMDAVAAIVGSWRWRKVNFIYEEVDSAATTDVPRLIEALQLVGSSISAMLPIPPQASLHEELDKLKKQQCRVFIVHTSSVLAQRLFLEAKKMGLMGKDSVWITTTSITNQFDYIDASIISSMQGVLGVKTYYPQTGTQYKDFTTRFRSRFRLEHPEEENSGAGIFAMQAYDAVQAVVIAMGRMSRKTGNVSGADLLENVLLNSFKGLTGEFRFEDGVLVSSNVFRIVNLVDKSYKELGIWSEGQGFSRNISRQRVTYNMSMRTLGQVVWPGSSRSEPRGWALPTSENPLMIGVPESPTFNQFVIVKDVEGKPSVNGYAIDVFKAVLDYLPYHLTYEFIPYNGSYDSLVEQIYHKEFDAVVGDTSIVANRCEFAEFSQPWTDSGLQMVVLKKSLNANRAWLFFKPFTEAMWSFTALVNIYNGFVVWLMERAHHPELNGSVLNKVGSLIWLAFATLFSLHGDRLHSNLSRMTMVVWLFVAIIIIQSYTANLSSLLTVPRIESEEISVEYLKKSNAMVGCDGGSFVVNYLVHALGLQAKSIRSFDSYTDYPRALEMGEIAAAFLEVPYIKVFLAEHCKDFKAVGPTYKIGGFGFVFSKGSPILPDITKAVLEVSANGKLQQLENALISSYNCSDSVSNNDSLGMSSFWGLFLITGGTTTIMLLLYLLQSLRGSKNSAKRKHLEETIYATPMSRHDPKMDELWMFASEIGNQGHHIGSWVLNHRHGAEETVL